MGMLAEHGVVRRRPDAIGTAVGDMVVMLV
jgi:hypothetical protein